MLLIAGLGFGLLIAGIVVYRQVTGGQSSGSDTPSLK